MNSSTGDRTRILKELALSHGFMGAGISRAEYMSEEAGKLESWLSKGYQGEMEYMSNHFDLRVDPSKLVPGAKSVISLMYNYYSEKPEAKIKATDVEMDLSDVNETFKISRYAYGEDYHKVVRKKLKALVRELKLKIGEFHGRVFVDSAPVMERDWAKRSGLGWVGKNTLLIHPKKGSYFFLAEIILDVEFDYDHPIRDHCGTCRKCIEACPTDAISPEGYVLDGSKCISYLTIELKSKIPDAFRGQMQDWIFGCDICQEVCPWNRFSRTHEEPAFIITDEIRNLNKERWMEITEDIFDQLFEKSPIKRTGHKGLMRNIRFAQKENHG